MKSDEIIWQRVPNNVASRMIGQSLIHKLIPCRKVQRRTKAMNTAIKHAQKLKTYSTYIKMKTSVLRDLSEDSDTDDNISFTEDDYSILYQSDLSFKDYMTRRSIGNVDYSNAAEMGVEENNVVSNMVNGNKNTKKPKNKKSSRLVKLGWHKVVRKKNTSISPSDKTYSDTCSPNSSVYSQRVSRQRDEHDNLNESNNNESSATCIKKDTPIQKSKVLRNKKKHDSEKSIDLHIKTTDSNQVECSTTTPRKRRRNIKSVGETNSITNDINTGFQSEEGCAAGKNIKENLIPLEINDNVVQENNKPLTNAEMHSDQNHSDCPDQLSINQENKNDKSYQIQSLHIGSTNQPKDSGIEEDTEEEFPENKMCMEIKKDTQETCQSMQITSSIVDVQSNSEVETSLTICDDKQIDHTSDNHDLSEKMVIDDHNDSNETIIDSHNTSDKIVSSTHDALNEMISDSRDTPKKMELDSHDTSNEMISNSQNTLDETISNGQDTSDIEIPSDHNTSDEIDIQDTTLSTPKNVKNSKENQDNLQRQRLQPKVTHSEIIKKRYRIISCNESLPNDCTDTELNMIYDSDEEMLKSVEAGENIDDSMSPVTERRLQQLRRLNLTIDSESSEDDDTYSNTENMRDKLLKRSEASSSSSSNENENVDFNSTKLTQYKKPKESNNYKDKKHRKETYASRIKTHENCVKRKNSFNNKESDLSLKLSDTDDNFSKHTHTSSPKKDLHTTFNHSQNTSEKSSKRITSCPDNKSSSSEQCSKIKDKSFLDNDENDRNLEIEKTVVECSAMRSRPCNIEEFIKEENLVNEIGVPSFVFKDIHEDDIFLLDIPSMVVDTQLIGKKIVLTEKKLKLGNHKYKITLKDVDHLSCVFSTGKSRKPYKTVNIKPVTRIVARQKIFEEPVLKSNQCTNDVVNYIEDISASEANTVSIKKHHKSKHNLSLKRKRLKMIE
ncbi:dentin sialophosphoprotein-like [Hylaeus volcanicus]|uniref:dentin sialophosphoprotein-like n=1 Tax=Hylaeus volcanicus TaxID=313075 RepID=UPI0023B7C00D|nr:dentin sialophosphoprotein-like [Hylaeus volcanicus]